MGLRTYRYGPPTITLRDDGGLVGNGVPTPSTGNRTNVATFTRPPSTIKATPRARTATGHGGVPASKRVISHGNSTRMNPSPAGIPSTAVVTADTHRGMVS
jgi:hypothetical protein